MTEKTLTIQHPSGLHARPASLLVQEASKFQSKITLVKAGKEVDAKSLLGVMSLAVKQGDEITVRAEGADAEQAVSALVERLENLSE
ncbi:phosphocarrier protein HPr [Polycladomyces abyssicola]|jgi:phosphocarrier protein HPr|uniref:Phosphocarrier protein HPr n=1 Tax=Polycladomyces abyssicola TaxID=1125966 RepID=A0A8D5UH39_9BACL|nr:HPr family phosphocarrier protein [Polycladomyces abyssicola]BCU83044.1 phosphocarrier protein HPr [Polycladomyces abyssicola]